MPSEMYLGMKIKRQGAKGDWCAYLEYHAWNPDGSKRKSKWHPRFKASTISALKKRIKQRHTDLAKHR